MSTPVKYDDKFKPTKLLTTKVEQRFEDGTVIKKVLPMFSGEEDQDGGVEAMFYVKEAYEHACKSLDWTTPQEKFAHFNEVLYSLALTYWNDEIENSVSLRQDCWTRAWTLMASRFSPGGKYSKDQLLDYLKSPSCRKLNSISVNEHIARILRMIHIADQLEGIENDSFPITAIQKKKIIIQSMPNRWVNNLKSFNPSYMSMNLQELQDYFNTQKEISDNQVQQIKNKRKEQDSKTSTNVTSARTSNKFARRSPDTNFKRKDPANSNANKDANQNPLANEQCRRHPYHKHTWNECYNNPKGKNFRGFRTNKNNATSMYKNKPRNNIQNNSRNEIHRVDIGGTVAMGDALVKDEDRLEAEGFWSATDG